MKRRILSFALVLCLMLSIAVVPARASESIKIGDYVQMGTYYGEPILWRCVDIDENGPLILSDKIICLKPFDASGTNTQGSHGRSYDQGHYYRKTCGSNYWADSNMRSWLNSNEDSGNIIWLCNNPPDNAHVYNGYNDYVNEQGFKRNFTSGELKAVKKTMQDSLLHFDEYRDMTPYGRTYHTYNNSIEIIVQNATTTAYREQVTDDFFLLDVKQINAVYNNRSILGNYYYIGEPTSQAVGHSEYRESILLAGNKWHFWLRSPGSEYKYRYEASDDVRIVYSDGCVYSRNAYFGYGGVRPAFYLDTNTATFISGNGTESNPYSVAGYSENPSKTITRIPAVVSHSYGAKTYESTNEGKIYDLAVAYNEACNNYLDTIKYQAKIDSGVDALINNAATRMYNEDHKQGNSECHLALAGFPNGYEMAAYKAYALYLLNYASKGVEMGKIKLSKDLISINADVIKYVAKNFHGIDFTCEYNNYVVTMKGWEYYGVGNGSITVQLKSKNGNMVGSRTGAFTSTQSEISNAMSSFIENWRDVTSDVLKQGLMSVFSELGEVTGFSDFVKEDIENSLKKFNNAMKIAGYGSKVISNLKNCKKGYDAIKGIIADTSPNQERLLNSLSNSKDIYNVLNGFDFNFSNIENAGVKSSMETLENTRKKLADALYNYTYGFEIDTSYDTWFQKTWLYRTFFQCPVDFTVYDENGNILGYVDNGEVYDNGDVHIEITGDVKVLYIPPELKVRIVMKGTDEGEMNCVLEELSDGEPVGRLNYYNLPLSEGTEYTQEINVNTIGANVEAMPIVSENGEINADVYYSESDQSAYVTIDVYSMGHGQVIGADEYPIGDPVTLTALSEDDNYQFVGWYDENDNFISNENIYRFTALIDTKLFAKFDKKRYIDNNIDVEVSEEYIEHLNLFVYQNDVYNSELNDIIIYDLNDVGVDGLYYTGYESDDIITENTALDFVATENDQYIVEGIDIQSYSKIEIFNNIGEMVATLTKLSIDDIEHTIEDYTIDNQTLTINTYTKNNTDNDISADSVICIYSSNDILKTIAIKKTDIGINDSTLSDFTITDYTYENGDYVKLFLWEGFANIKPLTNPDYALLEIE